MKLITVHRWCRWTVTNCTYLGEMHTSRPERLLNHKLITGVSRVMRGTLMANTRHVKYILTRVV
jgi:hypothetical protein